MSSPYTPFEVQEHLRSPHAQFFHLVHPRIVDTITPVTPLEITAHLAVRGQAEDYLPNVHLAGGRILGILNRKYKDCRNQRCYETILHCASSGKRKLHGYFLDKQSCRRRERSCDVNLRISPTRSADT